MTHYRPGDQRCNSTCTTTPPTPWRARRHRTLTDQRFIVAGLALLFIASSYPTPVTYQKGSSSKRQQLAEPVDDRIFFAGEGTSHRNPACVPGALQEGVRAARQVHALLSGMSNPPSS